MFKLAKRLLLLTVAVIVLTSGRASAQSALAGLVTDTSGAVMPGVTVEAASPALIEKVRSAVTDSQGRYNLIDLRPGTYTVTFALPGFSTVQRSGIELPSNFTATINAELKVGSLEETITVSGGTPVVDTHEATRTQVLNKDLLNLIPTSRSSQGTGAIIPGVKLNNPDVGGQSMMQNVTMTVHGVGGGNNAIQVDGLNVNTNQSDGSVQMYHNDAMAEEMAYQTTSLGADVSGGGVRLNMIPKQGGNTFAGIGWIGGTPSSWVNQTVPSDLATRGTGLKSLSSITHIYDLNGAEGGPLKKDKLWFFGGFRRNSVNSKVANNFYPDGSPAIEDQWIMNPSLRLTLQADSKNKFTAYYDRALKQKGHETTLDSNPSGVDIQKASTTRPWNHGLYYVRQFKWTGVPTSRVLLEAGQSTVNEYHTIICQPGVSQPYGSPAWYAGAPRTDLVLLTFKTACTNGDRVETPIRHSVQTAASYVTGSHNIKVGMQWSFGPDTQSRTGNADLVQQYRSGVPDSVSTWPTPITDAEYVKADRGIYVQDAWTLSRLTLNLGVRFEHFNSRIDAAHLPAGRFVPARNFSQVDNIPNWNDIAPRFGVAYDLFGTGKTAVKGSVSKYMTQWTGGFARRYTPVSYTATDVRNWTDVNANDIADWTPGCTTYPAVGCEIGPSNNNTFGLAAGRSPASDLKRTYNVEYSGSLQHQLLQGLSVAASYYHRHITGEAQTNTLLAATDYAAFQVPNPVDATQTITVYNLNKAKQGQVALVDQNSDVNHTDYNGFELSFMGRLKNINMFGGWTMERTIVVSCDGLAVVNPNLLRFCDQSGQTHQDLGANAKVPFTSEFKLAGSVPIAAKVSASLSLISYAGKPINNTYVVPANLFPGGQRTQSVTVPVNSPYSLFYDRWNQLDLGVRRPFKLGRMQAQAQFDVFNSLNARTVLTQTVSVGPALTTPQTTLIGRMYRISTSLKF